MINILYHSGYPNVRNIIFILFARILHYKVIFDIVEDNAAVTGYRTFQQLIKSRSSLFFFKRISHLADGIVCISETLYKKIKAVSKEKLPLILIPPSINENFFDNNLKETKKAKPVISIFYGGSFGTKDGMDYLLLAFDSVAELYNIELILTGKGNNTDMQRFNTKLDQLKNKDKVRYKGYLNDDEYFEILRRADIHCMVRTGSQYSNAGFPFKLAEMLATGKPVIATRVSDVEKYLTEKDAMLIEPEDTNAIAGALRYLIENSKMAEIIGRNGKEAAYRYFGSKNVFENFEKLIHLISERESLACH